MTASSGLFQHAILLDRRGGGRELDAAAAAGAAPADGLLWLHLDINDPDARRWITDSSGLDDLTAEALLAPETRPRVVSGTDGILVILRGVNTNPGADPEDMVSIRIWIERDRIITTRRRMLLSVQDVREAVLQQRGPSSGGEFLAMLTDRLATRIGAVVDRIDESIDTIEEQIDGGNPSALRTELGTLRRQTAAIRRYLAPQRDALNRLPGISEDWTRDENIELREQSDRTTRYLEDLDLSRERAIVAQEELTNRLAQDQNSRLYLLSVVAAIFLPLSFITGLLGMNVAGLPGTQSPLGFLVAVGFMAATAVLLLVFFRWKRWI